MSRNDWTDDKLLFRLINNKSEKYRWENISILRNRPSDTLYLKCAELTRSKDPKVRIIGIDVLAQMGYPRPFLNQSLKLFFHLLDIEKNTKVLESVLFAISHNNDNLSKAKVEKLCSFSESKSNLVKEGLVYSLLGVDDSKAIQTLIKLSADKLNYIRDWATFGIGTQVDRNNKLIREALWNRVNDSHQETKLEAILGLAQRKDSRVKEIIKREIFSGEYGVVLFEAVLEIGDKEFLPLLQKNLKSGKGEGNRP